MTSPRPPSTSTSTSTCACACACGILLFTACGHDAAQANAPSYGASAPTGPCGAVVQRHPIEGQTHVSECAYARYGTLPPSSGDHYPIWAAYRTYTLPVPEGYWVHDLEHGAIVFSYNCQDAGCAADIAAAKQLIDAFPDDPLCIALPEGVRHRFVMTPDPRLDVPFAASAWGWTLRASCFDPGAFLDFARAHYGQGGEATCANGADVVGTAGAPAGCGAKP